MTCHHGHCTRCCRDQTPAMVVWYRFAAAWGVATFAGSIIVWSLWLPESWGAWHWLFIGPTWLGAYLAPVLLYRRHVRQRAAGPAAAVAAYRKGKAA